MSKLWQLVSATILIAIVGCSDPGPFRIPVTGMLTLDGEPFPAKSLRFIPIEGTPGHGAAGFSDSEGSYRLQTYVPGALRDYRGCPPGKYLVIVGEPLIPITDPESTMPEQGVTESSEGPAPAIALAIPSRRPVKGGIPPIYLSQRTTPLVVEVAEGQEVIDLALDSKARSSLASNGFRQRD